MHPIWPKYPAIATASARLPRIGGGAQFVEQDERLRGGRA